MMMIHARATSDDRQVATWAALGLAVAIAVLLFLFTMGDFALPGVGTVASASPVPTASPSLTPDPTPIPTPTPVPTPVSLDAAFERFRETVDAGQQNGQIEEGAAEELIDRASRFVEDDDLSGGDINRASRDLHRAIDELEADGEISSSDLAASLRQMADDLEAAARRES